jgi:AcrR family transcriptional regulator
VSKNRNMSSPGLRERKKQKTRWAIQEHALRLFAEKGYEATTVDQIAAAAEISPSTFFRYFKTKEDLVVEDEYDAMMEAGLRDRPPEMPALPAIRETVRLAFAQMTTADRAKLLERSRLIFSVPALRARSVENLLSTIDLIGRGVAERTGRDAKDVEVRAFAGAVVGALTGVATLWIENDGKVDLGELTDEALGILERGLSL